MTKSRLIQLSASVRILKTQPAHGRFFTSSKTCMDAVVPAKDNAVVVEEGQGKELDQEPNRKSIWSRSQNPRSRAMTGPRFEQTDFDLQPQPLSAMVMVHQQPVRWTHSRIVSCDGSGGCSGHPRIFINTDKPEIAVCNYCGLPFANEHHRKHLESLGETSYPLS